VKLWLFSTRGPSSFFSKLIAFPPSLLSRPFRLLRSCLPHAIGSSRFGGHCTAAGGCGGMVGGGESIFHDGDVMSLVGKCLSLLVFLLAASIVASHVITTRISLQDQRRHPLQDAGRSILRKYLYSHVFELAPFKLYFVAHARNLLKLTQSYLMEKKFRNVDIDGIILISADTYGV